MILGTKGSSFGFFFKCPSQEMSGLDKFEFKVQVIADPFLHIISIETNLWVGTFFGNYILFKYFLPWGNISYTNAPKKRYDAQCF